jgi:hypothetical protein
MVMTDGVGRAQDRRSLLERIAARIPGIKGYLDRELRREVDKMQRDWLAEQVDRTRGSLNGTIREWSRAGNLAGLDLASTVEKALDRLANRIRHADYGYTGFFDAVKIRERELDALYEFDLELIAMVDALAAQVEALPASAAEPALRELLETITRADRRFDERARIFEDVTEKGGR